MGTKPMARRRLALSVRDVMLGLLAVAVPAVAFVGVIYLSLAYRPEYVIINCSLSEISPDFSTEMRQACRQARVQGTTK